MIHYLPSHLSTWILLIIVNLLTILLSTNSNLVAAGKANIIDTHKGSSITLKCRFDIDKLRRNESSTLVPLWKRSIGDSFDIISTNNLTFGPYKLEYSTYSGKYDLTIDDVHYERDNGLFECKVKEAGTGVDLVEQSYQVTVLSKYLYTYMLYYVYCVYSVCVYLYVYVHLTCKYYTHIYYLFTIFLLFL